jgi:hypothetical protein
MGRVVPGSCGHEKAQIALWRLGVLGPLISARLEHGDRRRYIEEAAARLQQQPDGTYVQLSPRRNSVRIIASLQSEIPLLAGFLQLPRLISPYSRMR